VFAKAASCNAWCRKAVWLLTWASVQPAGALKVFHVMAGDDVVRLPLQGQPLLSALLFDERHKGIGPTAEVHHSVPIVQVEAEQLSNLLQQMQLGEVAPIAAVPASQQTAACLTCSTAFLNEKLRSHCLRPLTLVHIPSCDHLRMQRPDHVPSAQYQPWIEMLQCCGDMRSGLLTIHLAQASSIRRSICILDYAGSI